MLQINLSDILLLSGDGRSNINLYTRKTNFKEETKMKERNNVNNWNCDWIISVTNSENANVKIGRAHV